MTSQTPAITIPSPRRGLRRRLVLGLAAAAALTVAVGAGLWQVARSGTTDTTSQATSTTLAAPASTRPVASAPTLTLVLAGSPAEADAVQARLSAAAALVAPLGAAALVDQLAVVTAADPDAFAQTIAEQHAMRAGLGLPSIRVVDLRTPPAAAPVDPLARELDALTAASGGVLPAP